MKRRNFIKGGSALFGGLLFAQKIAAEEVHHPKHVLPSPTEVADENYWDAVRNQFDQPTEYINLENGYFSPMASIVLANHQMLSAAINKKTSWFMRRDQETEIESARKHLAEFLGCRTQELALTRNTTESLNTVISGYPWVKGDEVIIGDQDYGSMVAAFKQAEQRYGIVIKVAKVPLKPESDAEVVDAYMQHVNPKTRLLHLTHLINLSGHVIPVTPIADAAHAKGIEVMVDAAHSVAQIPFRLEDLHADYIGASLHKWMGNALGTGFLWVKETHINKIWPLMADSDWATHDIRKFEHQGTRPIQSLQSIESAISFHNAIGSERIHERLIELMKLWCSKVSDKPGIHLNTPWDQMGRNSAIANVRIDGYTPSQLAEKLLKDFNIFTVAIDHPSIKGVRVTPHIFTKPMDLELLAKSLIQISESR